MKRVWHKGSFEHSKGTCSNMLLKLGFRIDIKMKYLTLKTLWFVYMFPWV